MGSGFSSKPTSETHRRPTDPAAAPTTKFRAPARALAVPLPAETMLVVHVGTVVDAHHPAMTVLGRCYQSPVPRDATHELPRVGRCDVCSPCHLSSTLAHHHQQSENVFRRRDNGRLTEAALDVHLRTMSLIGTQDDWAYD